MKKMRILALAMAVAMTASAFSGCADQGTTSSGTGDGGKTEVPTLKWYGIGGAVPANFKDGIAAINEYLTEKEIGAQIDVTVYEWGAYEENFRRMINGGDYFDIMFAWGSAYNQFVHQGAFLDITEKVKTVTPDLYKTIPENLWKGAQIDGKIYAVPAYKDSSLTQYWYFDHELVEKYNIDVKSVHTMDDLTPIFKTVKEGEGEDFYPVQLNKPNPWNGFWNDFDDLGTGLPFVGVKIDDESRKVVNVLEDETILHNLGLLRDWYEAGYINQDANVYEDSYKQSFFGSGQGWPAAAAGWATDQGIKQYDLTDPIDGPLYTSGTVQGSMQAIYQGSKYADEALKVLELANTDTKMRDMMSWGVEGVDFEYVEKKLADGSGTRKAVHQLTTTWTAGWTNYSQGSNFVRTPSDADADDTMLEEIKAQNDAAVESVCMGFVMDIAPVQNELSACTQIWNTYKPDMLTGARDPKELVPTIQQELKEAGFDTILEEAQKQVNNFFA